MNKVRREALAKISDSISDISLQVEDLMNEEQEYLDNMPVSLQGGEKGETASLAIENMQLAIDSLSEASNLLDEAAN